jgi:hypothetical protein
MESPLTHETLFWERHDNPNGGGASTFFFCRPAVSQKLKPARP